MTAQLTRIERFPIKSIGGERLDRVTLEAGRILPGDRAFAVLHADATRHLEDGELRKWLPKSAFLRGAAGPSLQAVRGGWDEAGRALHLTHPARAPLSLTPEAGENAALNEWLSPLWPADKARPVALVSAPVPLTDIREQWVSILSLSSLEALEAALGRPLGTDRWRGNLWISGWAAWAEREMIGTRLRIGGAELIIRERIGRCAATSACTETGQLDGDMPATLTALQGDADFGLYAEVITGADIASGDTVEVLP